LAVWPRTPRAEATPLPQAVGRRSLPRPLPARSAALRPCASLPELHAAPGRRRLAALALRGTGGESHGGWRRMEVEERSTIETSSLPGGGGGGCAARLLHHQTATQLLLFAAARARPDLRSSSNRRGATAIVAAEEGRLRHPRSELAPRPRLANRSSHSPAPCPTGARSPLA
jgi:hypothetical protein